MVKKHCFATAVIAVVVIVALAASLFVIAHEADHDCTGEGCHICAVIAACRDILKAASLIAALAVTSGAVFCAYRFAAAALYYGFITPISLKVKLLN